MRSSAIKLFSLVALALLAALALVFPTARAVSFADGEFVAIKPIEDASATVKYNFFTAPLSVYADASGLLVADDSAVYSIAPDMAISKKRDADADKVYAAGELIITLEAGSVHAYYGSDETVYSAASFCDIDIEGSTLYALTSDSLTTIPLAASSINIAGASTAPLHFADGRNRDALLLTVCDGKPFVAVDGAFRNKNDICSVSADGTLTVVRSQSDEVISLTSMDASGVIYALTRDRITGYAPVGGGLIERCRALDAQMTCLYAYDGDIYALDTLDAVCKISADLSVFKTLVASANDSLGFFNTPTAAAVKNSALYVADSANGRVAVYANTLTYIHNELNNPVAVACDSSGALYVAHDYNKISVYPTAADSGYTLTVDGVISALEVNADSRLFVLTASGLFVCDGEGAPVKATSAAYKAITLSAGRDELYALTDSAVKKLTVSADATTVTETDVCAASPDAFSLAVDLKQNVYTLSATAITKTPASGEATTYALKSGNDDYSLGYNYGHLVLGTVNNDYLTYGCAVIVDTYKHRVFSADGKTLGISLVDDDYDVPDVVDDAEPASVTGGLIRLALYDTPVFDKPMETPPVYTIAKDRKVIVPKYDLEDSREYSLILIDDIAQGKLIQGYVYKRSLSDPLPYVAPPADVGTVYSDATPVYKWPSPNAATVKGFEAIDRSTQFEILDFVKSYHDDYNNLWYRIRIADKYEGYILASNLSLLDYEPVFIRPAYNAEIIKNGDDAYAQTYSFDGNNYTPLSTVLPAGTRVEVVDAFDTSLKYTKIKYLEPELGTLTCYVETAHLKYNGSNVVAVVAVLVIVITVTLAIIIICRVMYVKKKRFVTNENK